ncbi:hypothetical protein EZV62_019656 [Acer yangbiense]|uniref:Acyl-ACP thioesterase-like C-terminal domain-containing protein n=1 Tax=Acer yangbiense TaxID=1000413 RepID=A0A5C7HBF6_9ROSI|nr:hypothetical protein EZV62_019656 [Acer yangbiense]
MTSMAAATSNVRLSFTVKEEIKKIIVPMAKVGYCSSWISIITPKRQSSLVIIASAASSNPRKVEKINGKKVNGIYVNEAPQTGKASVDPQLVLKENFPVDSPLHACLHGRFVQDRFAIAKENDDIKKIDKLTDDTAERIRSGLAPRWNDMDANQHSVPIHVLEHYNLTSMTLEYRRECRQSSLIESLTSTKANVTEDSNNNNNSNNRKTCLEYTHLLRMQADKAEIVRARSQWKSKHINPK